MTLKKEYQQAVKNGFSGTYKEWLKQENEKLDKVLKILNKCV